MVPLVFRSHSAGILRKSLLVLFVVAAGLGRAEESADSAPLIHFSFDGLSESALGSGEVEVANKGQAGGTGKLLTFGQGSILPASGPGPENAKDTAILFQGDGQRSGGLLQFNVPRITEDVSVSFCLRLPEESRNPIFARVLGDFGGFGIRFVQAEDTPDHVALRVIVGGKQRDIPVENLGHGWNHFIITYQLNGGQNDRALAMLYLNGEPIGLIQGNHALRVPFQPEDGDAVMTWGGNANGRNFIHAELDAIMIFDWVLSDSEMSDLTTRSRP